jgi:choline kinase
MNLCWKAFNLPVADDRSDCSVKCHVVEDLVWAEIDDERQLIRARDRVYPAILQREKPSGT